MPPIQWFEDRIGETVVRYRNDEKGLIKSYWHIRNQKDAEYLYDCQERGNQFEDKQQRPPNVCIACES